ncbi:HNH endonuclease signature motif containing protein [Vibrio cholerae]|uniref:HNH endonuclease n=1 Tax=Vibrio cholerae TaxID=666 RepID=UPI0021AF31D1|nr:HNH endonuclease signature motif containing protein [Vibrio cholerae]MDP4497517.1 HNH endonuclease signature motif containing protein [Vibrio cholerae]WLP78962.1 HNH endonuclease signature motif containing protein [Vibrio cholerae]
MRTVVFDNNGAIARLTSLAKPLTQDDIRNAVKQFLKQNRTINSYSESTTYDLIVDGKPYPPKAIFGLAMSKLLGIEVLSTHFSAGLKSPCFTTFENLGFEIRLKDGSPWSDAEMEDSVREYLRMLDLSRSGEKFNKTQIYRELNRRHKRTAKAYEFRMQNISYVFELLGRTWVTGLKPKRIIFPKHAKLIESSYIAECENRPFEDLTYFEANVNEELNKKAMVKPEGNKTPSTTSSSSFIRDPAVKAWVLLRANGICECCNKATPFMTASGKPYLEVHHLIRLIDDGPDTLGNCVTVCPKCHRELHYSSNQKNLTEELKAFILNIKRDL